MQKKANVAWYVEDIKDSGVEFLKVLGWGVVILFGLPVGIAIGVSVIWLVVVLAVPAIGLGFLWIIWLAMAGKLK